jgi:hypothetical protein
MRGNARETHSCVVITICCLCCAPECRAQHTDAFSITTSTACQPTFPFPLLPYRQRRQPTANYP